MNVFLNYYYKTLTIRFDNIVAIVFQKTISLPREGRGKRHKAIFEDVFIARRSRNTSSNERSLTDASCDLTRHRTISIVDGREKDKRVPSSTVSIFNRSIDASALNSQVEFGTEKQKSGIPRSQYGSP